MSAGTAFLVALIAAVTVSIAAFLVVTCVRRSLERRSRIRDYHDFVPALYRRDDADALLKRSVILRSSIDEIQPQLVDLDAVTKRGC